MRIAPVEGLPEVEPGDDLAGLLADAVDLSDGDVVCVASTVVSKAEGRTASLDDYAPGERAQAVAERISAIHGREMDPRFAQAVLEEATAVVMEAPFLLTETRFGHVSVNAGIDRSNVPDADLLLLPEDPTASAEGLSDALGCPVVVTDTSGRPFRTGQRGVAVGWAGMPAARDWRGREDRDGREMGVTVQAVVDELAGAANLVTGEGAGGTPVAVVSDWAFGDFDGSDELFRRDDDDLVRAALREWSYAGD